MFVRFLRRMALHVCFALLSALQSCMDGERIRHAMLMLDPSSLTVRRGVQLAGAMFDKTVFVEVETRALKVEVDLMSCVEVRRSTGQRKTRKRIACSTPPCHEQTMYHSLVSKWSVVQHGAVTSMLLSARAVHSGITFWVHKRHGQRTQTQEPQHQERNERRSSPQRK